MIGWSFSLGSWRLAVIHKAREDRLSPKVPLPIVLFATRSLLSEYDTLSFKPFGAKQ